MAIGEQPFIPLDVLFERERADHRADHDRERTVARETAQRLEREVEETAKRIEAQVQTALAAVGDTSRIHADAHEREHVSHERIHAVEKEQLDKAEAARQREAGILAAQLQEFKANSNKWREVLGDRDKLMWTRKEGELAQKQIDGLLAWQIGVTSQAEGAKVSKSEGRATRGEFFTAIGALAAVIIIVNVIILLVTR